MAVITKHSTITAPTTTALIEGKGVAVSTAISSTHDLIENGNGGIIIDVYSTLGLTIVSYLSKKVRRKVAVTTLYCAVKRWLDISLTALR